MQIYPYIFINIYCFFFPTTADSDSHRQVTLKLLNTDMAENMI